MFALNTHSLVYSDSLDKALGAKVKSKGQDTFKKKIKISLNSEKIFFLKLQLY